LAALNNVLRRHGQWLPVDPPCPESTTLASLVETAGSGPLRFGYGTIRDYVLSMRMTLADGTRVKSGARVAKNTAGFDVHRLFIGGEGAFGAIDSVGLRVRPIPERFGIVLLHAADAPIAAAWLNEIMTGPLRPVMLDLLTSRAARQLDVRAPLGAFMLAVGFDGDADTVEWQCDRLTDRMGECALRLDDAASRDVHAAIRDWPAREHAFGMSASLPSSRVVEFASEAAWLSAGLVARAGNGVVLLRADEALADEAVRPLVDFAVSAGGSVRITRPAPPSALPRLAGRRHDEAIMQRIRTAFGRQ
jgi:glycolate oxidase FAD binding subunit